MNELVKPVLTLNNGRTFIKKGLVEKELDCPHLFRLNWPKFDIRLR